MRTEDIGVGRCVDVQLRPLSEPESVFVFSSRKKLSNNGTSCWSAEASPSAQSFCAFFAFFAFFHIPPPYRQAGLGAPQLVHKPDLFT